MKLTTTETKSKEIEVTLPYFSKDGDTYYAIYTEDSAIKCEFIEYANLTPTARISTVMVSSAIGKDKITAKEFEYVFDTASDYLADEYEKMRDILRESKAIYTGLSINGEGEESINEYKEAV